MADEEKKLSRKERKALAKEEKNKKGKGGEEEDEDSKGSGILVAIVFILILAVWLAIVGLLIHMDVGGFGSSVLYPVLKDVPVINRILPETTEYDEEGDTDPYAFASMEEAVARVKQLEKQLAKAKKKNKAAASSADEIIALEEELQKYKDEEASFEETRQKFYEEVVYSDNAPDINSYKEFYESIEPEIAEKLYKQVVADIADDEELSDYVNTYSSMKASEAASIFNNMTNDLRLVSKILGAMDKESRGAILGKMDVETAAAVTKLLNPN